MTDDPQWHLDEIRRATQAKDAAVTAWRAALVAATLAGVRQEDIATAAGISRPTLREERRRHDDMMRLRPSDLSPDAEQPHPAEPAPSDAGLGAAGSGQTEAPRSSTSVDSSSSGLTSTSRAFDPSDGPTI